MKKSTILKGIIGLALIYLVCLPICAIGKVIEVNSSNTEISQKIEIEKASQVIDLSKKKKQLSLVQLRD